MAISFTSPVTGAAQTGFTAPTYTITATIAPEVNQKQWAVTALGGTQAGVAVHSGANPFTLTCSQPKAYKILGKANPITNVISNVPMNVYKVGVRKGAVPLAGQPYSLAQGWITLSVPSGADTADSASLRAMLSLLFGAATQQSAGIGDTVVSGLM